MRTYKTSLRYPGGKSRAVDKMFKHLPDMKKYDRYMECFLGGGSVAIAMTKLYPHLSVWVNDLYEPLYNFYRIVQYSGDKLSDTLLEIKKEHTDPVKARELFNKVRVQPSDMSLSNFDRALAFYITNKCSFSGLTESGSFSESSSKSNWTLNGIENLKLLQEISQKWIITNASYVDMLDNYISNKTFVYLDPPYDIKDNLYGKNGAMHKGFDHDLFANICNSSEIDMMISYNADNMVKERFPKWKQVEFDLTYTMRSTGEYMQQQKKRKELLLLNYEPIDNTLENFFV